MQGGVAVVALKVLAWAVLPLAVVGAILVWSGWLEVEVGRAGMLMFAAALAEFRFLAGVAVVAGGAVACVLLLVAAGAAEDLNSIAATLKEIAAKARPAETGTPTSGEADKPGSFS